MKAFISILIGVLLAGAGVAQADQVKLSHSGICHDPASPYYQKTQRFTAFGSLQECLNAGGRLPKNRQVAPASTKTTGYRREAFEHWSDDDGDCLNTRHELLLAQSTSTIDYGNNKCTVDRGRWNDPYTGKVFYNARDLDIDHVIPLKWAWDRGAKDWTPDRRKLFANDGANLFAVKAAVNREKGAKGALEWLPPDKGFHCQYVTRWKRLILKYQLALTTNERQELSSLHNRVCQ